MNHEFEQLSEITLRAEIAGLEVLTARRDLAILELRNFYAEFNGINQNHPFGDLLSRLGDSRTRLLRCFEEVEKFNPNHKSIKFMRQKWLDMADRLFPL